MTHTKMAAAADAAPPTGLTRKAFLGLSAGAAAAAAFAPQAMAQASARNAPGPRPGRTLIRGADLLTMDPTNKELQETDVLVENGKIAAIGKRLPGVGAEVIDARGMILMPGMIDGHRHMWHGLDAGRIVKGEPNAYAKGYIGWQRRTMACMTPEDNYLAELIGGLQAIDSGVTTVLDYAHGQPTEEKALAAARGVKDSGVAGWFTFQLGRTTAFGPGSTISTAKVHADLNTTTQANWKTVERLQNEVFSDSESLLQLGLAPSNATGRPVAEVRKEWERARATGVKMIAAHVHKTAQPQPAGTIGHRDSGILDLYEAGLLGPDYHASHGNRLTADEFSLLRETGGMLCATVVGEFPYMMTPHLMASAHGRARKAGVATGIGIDVTSVLQQDYFEHVRCAFLSLFLEPEGREIVRDYKSEDTLGFATALGAKAVRLGDVTGSITVGKRADLVLLRTDRMGFAMLGTLADRVMNFASQADIDSVWIAGKARKRHGRMLGVDWARLKAQQVAAQKRIGPQQASITFTT